jgi:hypothetical protein
MIYQGSDVHRGGTVILVLFKVLTFAVKNPSEIVHAIVFRGRLMKMNNLLSRFMHPHAYNNYTSRMLDPYYVVVFHR